MKPTQEQIDKVVAESREPCIVQGDGFAFEAMDYYGSVIVALADQLADAQRTAAQAVARVRELEGEREDAVLLLKRWRQGYHPLPIDDTDAVLASLTASAGKETDRG